MSPGRQEVVDSVEAEQPEKIAAVADRTARTLRRTAHKECELRATRGESCGVKKTQRSSKAHVTACCCHTFDDWWRSHLWDSSLQQALSRRDPKALADKLVLAGTRHGHRAIFAGRQLHARLTSTLRVRRAFRADLDGPHACWRRSRAAFT